MNKKLFISFLIFFFFCVGKNFSQEINFINIKSERLIEIPSLSSYDEIKKQFDSIVSNNKKLIAQSSEPEIIFFKYTNTENFNLLGLAARCCINYDTIATLNNIENSQTSIKNKTLILPTLDGLFIPVSKGNNSIEILLQENYGNEILTNSVSYYRINRQEFYFLQEKHLSPTERLYFLDSDLCLPVNKDSFWISSEFGKRQNPFSGKIKNHNGIDFACNEGTPVYAVKDGIVSLTVKDDSVFGNYLIISHDDGSFTSVYAHLSKITCEKNQKVKKGQIIGYSGQTGMVTGAHLHFEIRQNGKAEDPRNKLKLN